MPLEDLVAAAGLVGVILYGVLGGADFGGRVWDLFAGGPRRDEQRAAIAHAMGPVWEALIQYKSLSLEHHIAQGWGRFFHPEFGQRLTVASPQQRVSEDWYRGTADAVYQNLYSVEKSGAGHVLVLAADHVYKMDYRRMFEFHRGHRGPVTVATLKVPVAEAAGQFGVIEVDADARVTGFQEKPEQPTPAPGDAGNCLASMGIYVFTTQFLIDELRRNAEGMDSGHDFGTHILPRLMGRESIRAFTFSGRGTGAPGYWRDVGTVDAYY
jgi:glucose-1-phosphate adenylyltransferase